MELILPGRPERLELRKACMADLDEILPVYADAVRSMERNGIYQWDEIYPDREIIASDINKGEMYIVRAEDGTVAAYTVNKACDEEYRNGKWLLPHASYFVVHRLCVSPAWQGSGLGTAIMRYIEKWALEHAAQSIRLDCFMENPYAIRMYKRLGFHVTGRATWRKGDFYLMEKVLIM